MVRTSGSRSLEIAKALFRTPSLTVFSDWPANVLRYGCVVDPSDSSVLDRAMAVFFKSPGSYTGEDAVEFHLHGSPVLCDRVVRLATGLGARLATPGEFTQRAFLNGKLDLAQAESVLDLIHSRTSSQAKLALSHLEGRFSKRVAKVREKILHWLCLLEAEIDFGDEIDNLPATQQRQQLQEVQVEIESLLQDAQQGRLVIDGLKTVFVGAPNAGKSSLLNAMLQEDRALVSPVAGTTRDRIDVDCVLHGLLFNLTDTAGLRQDSHDEIEKLGMLKTSQAAQAADFMVLVVDSSEPSIPSELPRAPDWILLNKCDLNSDVNLTELKALFPETPVFQGELLTESGREAVIEQLVQQARTVTSTLSGECFSLNQRHREGLVRAQECLNAVKLTLDQDLGAEFIALDLRRAAEFLGQILGLDITEEVLDRIFGQFCLGK